MLQGPLKRTVRKGHKTSWTKNWPLVCQGLRGRGAFANKKAACMGELFRGRELFFFLSVVVVRWLCVFVMSQNDTLKRINFIMWIEKNQLRHIWFKTSNEFKSIFIECLLWAGPGWVVWGKQSLSQFLLCVDTNPQEDTHTGNKSLPWGGGRYVPNKGTKKI